MTEALFNDRRGKSPTRWRSRIAPSLVLFLLFSEQMLFGGEEPALSVAAAVLHLTFAAVLLLALRQPRLPGPEVWIPFAGVLLLGVLQMVPLSGPLAGLANPAWSFAGKAPIISLDPWATRAELVKLLGLGATFLIGLQLGADDRWRRWFFTALAPLAAAYGLWAAVNRILSPQMLLGVARAFDDRLSASFLSANTAGTLFAAYLVIAVCLVAHNLRRLRRDERPNPAKRLGGPIAMLLTAMICLLATASRGAAVAATAALLAVLAALAWDRSRRDRPGGAMAAVGLGVLATGVVLFLVSGQAIADRMGSLQSAVTDRGRLYAAYWRAVQDAPMTGYGLGAFQQINGLITPRANPMAFAQVGAAHNVYLQWLLEAGGVGAVLMAVSIGAVVLACARGYRRERRSRTYVVAALGVLMVTAVHGLSDFALQVWSIPALSAVLLGIAYAQSERRH